MGQEIVESIEGEKHTHEEQQENTLSAAQVRNKLEDDNRHLIMEEEKQYAALKNQLIEI